jgi:hypothetical protein
MVQTFSQFLGESNASTPLTKEQIKFLNAVVAGKWFYNQSGKIDVTGDVRIHDYLGITEFPVQFGTVSGKFDCDGCNKLISLKGAPRKIEGEFYCGECNSLTSLEGGPETVEGSAFIRKCQNLTSLKGGPSYVGLELMCQYNTKLKTLEGAPKEIGEECTFGLTGCESLESLMGAPIMKYAAEDIWIGGCRSLPVEETELKKNHPDLFNEWLKSGKKIKDFLQQKRGTVKGREFGF